MNILTLRTIWNIFSKYRLHLTVLVVLGLLSAVLEGIGINAAIPLLSFFMGGQGGSSDFISRTLTHLFGFFHIPFSFRYVLFFILGLFVVRSISVVIFSYVRGWISADFLSEESEDVLQGALRSSWPFLLKQRIGTLQNTLVRDIQRTSSLLEVTGQIIQSFSGFCMYLLVALSISPIMTLCTLCGGGGLVFVVRPFLIRSRKMGEQIASTEKGYSQFLTEHIIGMKVLKAAGAEEQSIHNGNTLIRQLRELSMRQVLMRSLSTSLFQPFSLIFIVILFVISYKSPGFSIAAFAATLYLIQKIFTYLESGQNALHSITELMPYAQNVSGIKKAFADNQEAGFHATKDFTFTDALVFNDVSFSYSANDPILKNITYTLKRGETLAVIGPSGAGKTTVADLLLRLFTPTSGTIALDQVPISDIHIQQWRKNIGYVAQDVFLFNGTIEENIRFYRPDLTHEEIIAASKKANSYNFVMSLQDGFKTHIGDRGVMLSGGQRQRIALTRALAGNPQILILDEATSALDKESEEVIQEALRDLQGRITVLIIAHRLSTIEHADRIVVLEKGRVIEQGTPKELEADPTSYFYRVKHVR